MSDRFQIDTSALVRRSQQAVDDRLAELIGEGTLARCPLVDLELLRGAPGGSVARLAAGLDQTLRREDVIGDDLRRARDVQAALAASGAHRGVPPADLVIAAVAERAGATLLHYDADFDRIAAVTRQPVEWVVPAGTAD